MLGPGRRVGERAVAASGWLACPGPRPAPRATIGGHPAVVRVEPYAGEPLAGIPAQWSVWHWKAVGAPAEPLTVTLLSADGGVLVSRDLRVDGSLVPAPQGAVDHPAEGAVVAGDLIMVSGWLLLDDQLPSRIEVEVDGGAPVRARLMMPRPDLTESAPGVPDAAMSGFEARVPVDVRPGETRRVSVLVRGWSRDGRPWTAGVRRCTVRRRTAEPAELAESRRARAVAERLLAATPRVADSRHVLVVAHSLRIGGGELWLFELLSRLVRDHGLRVTVVAQADGALRAEFEALGIGVRLTGDRPIRDVAAYETQVTELSLLMRSSGAGVVLVNTLGFFAGVDAALRASLPVCWAIHESFALADFAYLNWGPNGLAPPVRERWLTCLAEADTLAFVADATREMFLPYSDPRRCVTVRYGIDPAYLSPPGEPVATTRERLGVPVEAQVVVTVGVSEPRKGHGPLLAAFESVLRRHPDAYLVIVGMFDSPYSAGLAAWVAGHGLTERVRLMPIVRDPLPWLRIADLFVNCSDIESLPRTILEAMALRVPVLATDVFGARELITDGESGWLILPNDLNALTVGLVRALETPPADRARLATRARARVEPFLDSAGYGSELAKILGNLADTAPGGAP